MAKPNYSYEKRQKELAKQRKKQDKLQRKGHKQDEPQADMVERPAQPPAATLPTSGAGASATQDPAS